jgi:hypothetical protein
LHRIRKARDERDELLTALKDLLRCVESDDRVKRGDYYHERKAAHAAIAKAEG